MLNNKEDIKAWLDRMAIKDYEIACINALFCVDVRGDVILGHRNLDTIPVRFRAVHGTFDCAFNNLKSLVGGPLTVSRNYYCSFNQLDNLIGSARKVDGNFEATHNKLLSLKGSPKEIGGAFNVAHNEIESLEFSPECVWGDIDVSFNKLKTLKGATSHANGYFNCSANELATLEWCPEYIVGEFNINSNCLEERWALRFFPKTLKSFLFCQDTPFWSEELQEKITGHYHRPRIGCLLESEAHQIHREHLALWERESLGRAIVEKGDIEQNTHIEGLERNVENNGKSKPGRLKI